VEHSFIKYAPTLIMSNGDSVAVWILYPTSIEAMHMAQQWVDIGLGRNAGYQIVLAPRL